MKFVRMLKRFIPMSEMKKLHVVSLTNGILLSLLTAQTKYVIALVYTI